ncbi:MAG: GIN domain-containing protein, partial [Bacteroidales bacterium]
MKKDHVHINKLAVFLIAGLLLLTSCRDSFNKCLSGTGEPATERRKMHSFRNIEVYDNIRLEIIQAEMHEVQISAGEKLIPMIRTRIENDVLLISNESICPLLKDQWKPVHVVVSLPELDTLLITTQAEVKFPESFRTDKMFVRVTESAARVILNIEADFLQFGITDGTADAVINGYCRKAFIYNGGYGPIDSRGFYPENLYLNSNSTNHIFARAGSDYTNVIITFTGNIYYTGETARLEYFRKGS